MCPEPPKPDDSCLLVPCADLTQGETGKTGKTKTVSASRPKVSAGPLEKIAPVTQAHLNCHVFVCTGKSCSANDSQATLEAFWAVLKDRGLLYGKRGSLDGRVIVTTCGSIGLCACGPAVLIYPDGTWYHGVTADDVPQIVDEHIVGGQPVQRLLAYTLTHRE